MFKRFFTFIFLLFISSNSYAEFDVKARTAILQDFLSGEILFEKDRF